MKKNLTFNKKRGRGFSVVVLIRKTTTEKPQDKLFEKRCYLFLDLIGAEEANVNCFHHPITPNEDRGGVVINQQAVH